MFLFSGGNGTRTCHQPLKKLFPKDRDNFHDSLLRTRNIIMNGLLVNSPPPDKIDKASFGLMTLFSPISF